MKRKRIVIPLIFLLFFTIGGATFYFFGQDIQRLFFTQRDDVPGGAIARNEKEVQCKAGDTACEAKNEKIKANKLDGAAAKFVSHQCNGPRACPDPTDAENTSFISAIKAYAKSPNLELIRITGITPTGMIYYCAEDERCWSYHTKEKKVTVIAANDKPSDASDSAESI